MFLRISIQINIVDIFMIVRSYDLWDVNFTRNLDAWIWQMAIIGEEGKREEITIVGRGYYSTAKCMIVWSNQDHTFVFVLLLLPFKLANVGSKKKGSKNKAIRTIHLCLEKSFSNFFYISFLSVYFENLIVEFYISYVLNMYIKFHSNRILYTIWLINLFFIYNFRYNKDRKSVV